MRSSCMSVGFHDDSRTIRRRMMKLAQIYFRSKVTSRSKMGHVHDLIPGQTGDFT